MQTLDLPEPIAAYFTADQHDGRAVARCFTPDGRVLDEKKIHTGTAQIEAWKDASSAKYTYVVQPRKVETLDRTCIVTSEVAGNFPGSPVQLRYAFTLERDKIASLEIAP
ncbi:MULTISPECIES: nuclear transport factor 2 family protein [Gammaproteobacteria]|jgi:hypothetical protein|uniref:nuclear transport factor 2 family protein n=1 Tax=Gammaproteobacteria TaxID=1236 RepID=UPI00061AFD62|nr:MULTISPECIES: nuclear transport factor 2 family protein [Gammaproteobacteria]WIA63012.1 nuclear transport factor 2 family protein [Stenotrophomonas sp. BIO128-Bstrain]